MKLISEIEDLERFKGYGITSCGRVWSFKTKRFLSVNKKGIVQLVDENGYNSNFKVGRLVAKAYIPNVNFYGYIGHKDGNPEHNWVNNLFWTNDNRYDSKARRALNERA